MSFVDAASVGYYSKIFVIINVVSYNIGPHYNGTRLYCDNSVLPHTAAPPWMAS